METTPAQLTAAFAEWDRRYREEPAQFSTEAQMASESVQTLAESQTAILLSILAEQNA